MTTSNAGLHFRSDDPVWHFLAEFSLHQFLADQEQREEVTGGCLFQTVRGLGIPPERVENIEMTLAGFAREALDHFNQERLESPARIRVFCEKKLVNVNGGWGYFLIERGGTGSTGSVDGSPNSVDLYLYKEGD